jgi:hypothetical protein
LFSPIVNYGRKKVLTLAPGGVAATKNKLFESFDHHREKEDASLKNQVSF